MINRIVLAFALVLLLAGLAQAQSVGAISGRWEWKETARKNKPQTQFSIVIRRAGKVVRGTYSVDEFINGEWQGEDGNQTAFMGRVKGTSIEIKFDPAATVPGYQENVTYHTPADGRQPSVAVLTMNGRILVWQFVSGDEVEGVPHKLSLHRARARQ